MATESFYEIGRRLRRRVAAVMLACMAGSALTAGTAAAQNRYVYFPTANPKDGHFLSIAGAGFQTLAGEITMKIASPSTSASVEVGIFDGETGGTWDYGNIPLFFTLYADPNGDGSGTQQIAQWNGATMPDNAWFSATVNNTPSARNVNGDYFYMLKVTTPNAAASYLSVFKVRTNGTVAVTANQPFAYIAPLNSLADAQIVYPSYPTLTTTTYDGIWNFYLDVQTPQANIEIWDGDMDYGKYDCTENDGDDEDTPNELPSFSVGSAAVAEGQAGGGVPCMNASGVVTSGYTTSNPPDDSQRPTSQRSPSVTYEVIDPNGVHYANTNPSGNVEWERFRISTDAFDRSQMDYHADALPAGVYQIRIAGVDMSNLNAWRFPYDALGVDSTDAVVLPIRPYNVHGIVFYDANSNAVQDADEPGLGDVDVVLSTGDTVTTDSTGNYKFEDLDAGSYAVRVNPASLAEGLYPVSDFDGVATPNTCNVTLGVGQPDRNVFFGYKRDASSPGGNNGGHDDDDNCRPWTYWSCHTSHWPLSYITIGCQRYSKSQAIKILRGTSRCNSRSTMLAEIIAAKLNVANGCSRAINWTVDDAEDWMNIANRGNYCDYDNGRDNDHYSRNYGCNGRNNRSNRYDCNRRDNNRNYDRNDNRNYDRDDNRNYDRDNNRNYDRNDNNYNRNNNQCADRSSGARMNETLHRYNNGQGCPANMH